MFGNILIKINRQTIYYLLYYNLALILINMVYLPKEVQYYYIKIKSFGDINTIVNLIGLEEFMPLQGLQEVEVDVQLLVLGLR